MDTEEIVYLVLLRTSEGYLFAYNDGVQAGTTLESVSKQMPDYNQYHACGGTWSASATLYWLHFRPCVVKFDFKDIEDYVIKEVITISTHCGRHSGIRIKPEKYAEIDAMIVFDRELITEEVNTCKKFYE